MSQQKTKTRKQNSSVKPAKGRSQSRERRIHIVITVFLLLLLIFYMMPFITAFINSFKEKRDIIKSPLKIFGLDRLRVENYGEAYRKMNFPRSFRNSLIVTGTSVLLILITSSMTAYYFVRRKSAFRQFIFVLMIASMVIPFQVIMIPLVSIYGSRLHMLNSHATLILMHTGFSTAMAVFLFHGFIRSSVPVALEEAALIDGCTTWQTFSRIVFPLLKPISMTVVILFAMGLWNDFLLPSLVLTDKSLITLPIATQSFYGTYSSDLGLIMASLIMVALPIIVLYLFLQRYIIEGVVAGAVKA